MLRIARKRKNLKSEECTRIDNPVIAPGLNDETDQIEEELFGDIAEQFIRRELPNEKELFVIDRGAKRPVWHDQEEEEREIQLGEGNITKKLKEDPDQNNVTGKTLEERLRSQFSKIHGKPNWLTSTQKKDSTLMASTGHITKPSVQLSTKKLAVTRCKNLNAQRASKCVVQSSEFNSAASIGLIAGYSKTMDLFEVDGQNNKHLHAHHFTNFPIDTAKFTVDGASVILGSKRPYFYTYDLNKCVSTKIAGIRNKPNVHFKRFSLSDNGEFIGFQGHEGLFSIFSAKDMQLIKCLQHRQRLTCLDFLTDNIILTAGKGGFCSLWDNRTWKPISEFEDDGALIITCFAKSESHIAIGSDSGVVNIYNRTSVFNSRAKPLKTIMNLTTDIDNCVFNSSGELLAISSKEVKHALRLVNLHSLHCVSNWPTNKTPLGHVNTVNFSPNSGYITVGNDKGKALLYKLNHYPSY